MSHGGSDISFANGLQWRKVRSFCVREFLSKDTLNSLSTLRQQEIRRTLRSLYAKVNTLVYIRQEMHPTMLNVIMNMLWGGTFNDEDKIRIGLEFGRVAEEVVEYVGKTNISDFFPILARLDLQGIERRMKELVSWLDSFFCSIIEQRTNIMEIRMARMNLKIFYKSFYNFRTKENPELLLPLPTSRLCLRIWWSSVQIHPG
ncbi:cytochrome P450 750A1-like isoform X1 [Papaver somniferum]|uniref:cytochrome P450 750A1-like isoform X1 n=1 Tax=Papaver somniferum TaxID=3469 RepID=UPI000E704F5C|nr:cytochrome P450 750A1-like isoform X1 [Papaver somniferum]